jgi:hypothetical protein
MTTTYKIQYLDKTKGFNTTEIVFSDYSIATQWGKANLENFHTDMIKVMFGAITN